MEETKLNGPIDPDEARELIAGDPGIKVLDIRPLEDRESGYVPGSTHVDEDELTRIVGSEDGSYVIVCRDGTRSEKAAAKLRDDGIEVASIKGGMDAWNSESQPIQPRKDYTFKGPGGAPGT